MEYKLCPNNLNQLVQFGFKINWTLLQIGYFGDDFIPPQFTQKDIITYALEQLKTNNNNLTALLACTKNDSYEFENILKKLAKNEGVSKEIQIRKLRALIVFRNIETMPDDYTEGLIKLTEIWVSLGLPDDCPHIIQGRNNSLSPDTYYTKEMYDTLKKKNFDWLDNEISYIIFKEHVSV